MKDVRDQKGRFQTGNTGGGRPKGSRNKLGEEFLAALHDDFAAHGRTAIERVREEKPADYMKVIASILPKDLNLNLNPAGELTDEELRDRIRTLSEQLGALIDDEGVGDPSEGEGAPPVH